MVRQILSSSRYFILVAVLGSFLSAATVVLYGGITVLTIIYDTIRAHDFNHDGAQELSVELIEMIDVFLLGTVLYIVALGLYELFINSDLPMPEWLIIRNLDELKAKVIGVIIVLLAVSFLGEVSDWQSGNDILYLGLAIASVIIALTFVVIATGRGHGEPNHESTNTRDV